MAETKKIIQQSLADLASLANQQIGVLSGADADLGFLMWGGKDSAGDVVYFLAKDKPGQMTTLTLTDATVATGSSGIVSHSATGLLAGDAGINLLSDVNITSVANGNYLSYDSGTSKWVNVAPTIGMNYQGVWDANANSPALSSGGIGGSNGDFYIVDTAGTTSIDGVSEWAIGDWIVNNGSQWDKIDNTDEEFTLDDCYDHEGSGVARTINIDDGHLAFTYGGSGYVCNFNLEGGGASSAFNILNGNNHFNITRPSANVSDWIVDMRDITIDSRSDLVMTADDSMAFDCDAGISIDAGTASNLSVTTGDLDITTITSGDLTITAADLLDISAGASCNLNITGAIDIDSSTTLDMAAGTLMTIAAGANLDVNITGTGTIDTTTTLDLNSGTELALTAGANLDIDVTGATTIDSTTGISIDAGAASNLSVTSANLGVSTITSGDLAITAADLLDISAGASCNLNITGAIDIDSSTTLDMTAGTLMTIAAGANLDVNVTGLATVDTSTTLDLTAGTLMTIAAGANLDINVTGATTIDSTTGISIDSGAASNLTVGVGNLTIAATTNDVLIDAGALVSIDATTTIDWSGTNASLTTAGALAIASDMTLTGGGTITSTSDGNITIDPNGTGTIELGATVNFSSNAQISTSGIFKWGPSGGTYGELTWDTNLAVVAGRTGKALHLRSNNSDALVFDTSHTGTFTGGLEHPVTTVAAATYDLLVTDYFVHVTYTGTGAVTSLTLPTAQAVAGRTFFVKDAGGNASANNITIDTGGAETIDGSATLVLNTDYEWVQLYSDGTDWFVVG